MFVTAAKGSALLNLFYTVLKFSLQMESMTLIGIYLDILAKLLKLQRFDSINYLDSINVEVSKV